MHRGVSIAMLDASTCSSTTAARSDIVAGDAAASVFAMSSAADRRGRLKAQVYRSHAAQERDDPAYWAALPAEERVLEVWRLSEEQWRMRGDFPDEPGLCRSVARLRRP
jgi:hypothetical protein